jgi:hypothetical protein
MNASTLSIIILNKHQSALILPQLPLLQKFSEKIYILDDFSSAQDVMAFKSYKQVTVFQHHLKDDYSAHRNSIFSQIQTEWTLFLDADEVASVELLTEIQKIIQSDTVDAIFLPRRDIFLGKLLRGGETAHTKLLRCARSKLGAGKWQRPIHEVWEVPSEKMCTTHAELLHFPHANLTTFLKKLQSYAQREPLARSKPSRVQWGMEFLFYPPGKFFWNYLILSGWKDGSRGAIHAFCMAYYSLITRVYLYESYFLEKTSRHEKN